MIYPWSNMEEFTKYFDEFFVPYIAKRNKMHGFRHSELYSVMMGANLNKECVALEYGPWPLPHFFFIADFVKEMHVIENWQLFNRGDGMHIAEGHSFGGKKDWLSFVKEGPKNIIYSDGDIQHTHYEDKTFDRVLSLGVHEHVVDDLQGMKEINRILKDDGLVSMTVDFWVKGLPYNSGLQGRIYDKNDIVHLVNESGFIWVNKPDEDAFVGMKNENSWSQPNAAGLLLVLKKKDAQEV